MPGRAAPGPAAKAARPACVRPGAAARSVAALDPIRLNSAATQVLHSGTAQRGVRRAVRFPFRPDEPRAVSYLARCRAAEVQRKGGLLAWEASASALNHRCMRGERSEIAEDGWGLLPCPSCGGRGTKSILPRRELVAMRSSDRDALPVQASLECLLCVGTGTIQFRESGQQVLRPSDD